jgi:hypothetical protein
MTIEHRATNVDFGSTLFFERDFGSSCSNMKKITAYMQLASSHGRSSRERHKNSPIIAVEGMCIGSTAEHRACAYNKVEAR